MAIDHRNAFYHISEILRNATPEQLQARLSPKLNIERQAIPRFPGITDVAVNARWKRIQSMPDAQEQLLDAQTQAQMLVYQHNIENFIGCVKLPVGIAGPLRVNGLFAQGDYIVPLATTEAALVASYNRGSRVITEAGGCTAVVLNQGVSRAPGFAFENLINTGLFLTWLLGEFQQFKQCAEATTRFGLLKDMRVTVEGNHVYLIFEYTTGDAAGQNMVTIATQAIVQYIIEHSPIKPAYHFLEANMSGDKKASGQSFSTVRGKKVTTEVVLPAALIKKYLYTTAERMVDYWRMSALGGVLSGTIGVQGHYANGLAAIYIACGQDAACVAESSIGVTRFELINGNDLYAAVTLPNLIVGTVGGGTGLPSQKACLDILGLQGANNALAFAEVCAALCLAGELSIIGALCAGHFARAHQQLARGKQP